jgi:hypothetical protein
MFDWADRYVKNRGERSGSASPAAAPGSGP